MIRLLFVGDGDRDAATNPHLVSTIIGTPVEPTTSAWARLHRPRGYEGKLLFSILQARDAGLDGVVATIDQDKSPGRDRVRELQAGRSKDRDTHPPFPTAVGVAKPHAEAWLLDDPHAVRTALRLPAQTDIPTVRQVDSRPKAEIGRLHRDSPRCDEPIGILLVEIAQAVVPTRCQHARETGFAQFVEDVRHEIGPLATAPPRA